MGATTALRTWFGAARHFIEVDCLDGVNVPTERSLTRLTKMSCPSELLLVSRFAHAMPDRFRFGQKRGDTGARRTGCR